MEGLMRPVPCTRMAGLVPDYVQPALTLSYTTLSKINQAYMQCGLAPR